MNPIGGYTDLGVAGITLFILFFVVKYFVSAMTKKDAQIIDLVQKFNTTIDEHLKQRSEDSKKSLELGQSLIQMLEKMPEIIVAAINDTFQLRRRRGNKK